MIELTNVHKSYGAVQAVRGVSFAIGAGEIVGLLGPNGAGKTTILKLLTGFHFPSSGLVQIAGHDVSEHPLAIKRRIGYLPENAPLYQDFTVQEYLQFAARARQMPREEQEKRITAAVAACGLDEVLHRPVAALSKGFRQRTGLAQAILHDPDILILDEPTSGLDPNQILEIRRLIRNLGERKTVLLSTHIMQEVEALCGRVLILNRGRIAATGTASQIAAELAGAQRFAISVIVPEAAAESVFDSVPGIAGAQNVTVQDVAAGPAPERTGAVAAEAAGAAAAPQTVPAERRLVRVSGEVALQRSAAARDIDTESGALLFDWAVARGYKLVELRPVRHSLEDLFAELTRS